jgi:8-oxo-dGTP pyrophosphatase MutT (NUDIX family)
MIERVRAILITDDERLLVIKRTRPGVPTYWVLPGGHVESDDTDLESALHRELHEEIAGEAEIHSLIQVLDADDGSGRQYFYLARIHTWHFGERTGPEFTDPDLARGAYDLDQIPLTADALAAIDLKPASTAVLVREAVVGLGLFALADLRSFLAEFQ